MKHLMFALGFAAALAPAAARAQAYPPNEMGVTMGHWHLNSRDVETSKKMFVTMGGTAIRSGNFEVVRFPGVAVFLHQGAGTPPATGGTVGSVINHVGFLVPNVQEAVARWKAAGVPVDPPGQRTDQAFVTTADGLRIEILEDKAQTVPIRHHHVHFWVPEAEIPKIQAWYAKHFGATPGMRGQNQAGDIPGANLSYSRAAQGPTVTTRGRVLDHIGFDVRNLAAFMKKLEADGVKIERPYTKNQETGSALGFVSDPWGTLIELNERPKPL